MLPARQYWFDGYLKDNSWLTTVASLKQASLVSTEEENKFYLARAINGQGFVGDSGGEVSITVHTDTHWK